MPTDVDAIVIGANATIWTAAVGTDVPATEVDDPGDGWVDLGFTGDEGIKLEDSRTVEAIKVHQSLYPARRVVTEKDFTASFLMRQWGIAQVQEAFGATVEEITGHTGHYKITPPPPEDIIETAHLFDWVDGGKHYRLVIPRGMIVENVETTIARGAASDLPVTIGSLAEDGTDPWYILTDDAAFAA